jgi:PAS domain S-box-containing protein
MHALANPLVAGEFGLRFYVGVPLRTHDGFNLGTLCVIDRQPRPVSEPQIAQLKALASIVMDQMELRLSARRAISDLSRMVDEKEAALRRTELMVKGLRESEARLQVAVSLVKLGRYAWNPKTNELQWDETLRAMWGLPADAPVDYDVWRAGVHPEDLALVEAAIQRCVDPQGDGVFDVEYRVIGKSDGVERWIATRGQTNFENHAPVSFYGVALDVTDRKTYRKDARAPR